VSGNDILVSTRYQTLLMARKQMIGSETSVTRTRLLDAAEAILREEGYAAVTSRRVGARAEINPKLVHYYFPTMDDLLLTLYRRTSSRFLEATEALLQRENPLRVLWQTSVHPGDVDLFAELLALGNRHKAIQDEMGLGLLKLRKMQLAALDRYYDQLGIEPPIPTPALLLLLAGAGLLVAQEQRNGHTLGHAEAIALFERLSSADESRQLANAIRPHPTNDQDRLAR